MEKKDKISLVILLILLLLCCYGIWKYFDNNKEMPTDAEKFVIQYSLVPEDNVYNFISANKSLDLIKHDTGILFLCFPESKWCQEYAKLLNEVAKENNFNTIYYLNLKKIRNNNLSIYKKLVEAMNGYLSVSDEGIKTIYAPHTVFIKNGKIVACNNETSLIHSEINLDEYWNKEKIESFKKETKNNILLIK